MPAKGAGLAILKWVTSFPATRRPGCPCDGDDLRLLGCRRRPLALVDVRAMTAPDRGGRGRRRSGAGARDAHGGHHRLRPARDLGRPLPRGRPSTGRASASTPTPRGPAARGELGWEEVGAREDALACTCHLRDPRERAGVREATCARPPPQHARCRRSRQGRGRAQAVARCELFCDEWAQASHGGELTGAVEAGLVSASRSPSWAVLTGSHRGVPLRMGLPCSTPQAWRSRTSHSASRSSKRTVAGRVRATPSGSSGPDFPKGHAQTDSHPCRPVRIRPRRAGCGSEDEAASGASGSCPLAPRSTARRR